MAFVADWALNIRISKSSKRRGIWVLVDEYDEKMIWAENAVKCTISWRLPMAVGSFLFGSNQCTGFD